MKGRKAAAIVLSAAIIVSGMGTVSMAENSTESGTRVESVRKASDSNAETGKATPSEPDRPGTATPSEPDRPEDATPSDATYVSTERELWEALENSDNIVLNGEIKLTEPLKIFNTDLTLSGGKITYGGDGTWTEMIGITKGAKVTFQNITVDATDMDCNRKFENNGESYDKDYYAIIGYQGSNIILEEGTNIVSDNYGDLPTNVNKRGISITGNGKMNGGSVSGFVNVGIVVSGSFTINDGEIKDNGFYEVEGHTGTGGLATAGKRATEDAGKICINGGTIANNRIGIFNSGNLVMNGGKVIDNKWGIFNNNHDGITNEIFAPEATLNGGLIAGNEGSAITNTTGGTVRIGENCVISDRSGNLKSAATMSARAVERTSYVVQNTNKSTLIMSGGTITAYAPGSVAVLNDNTSTVKISGGEISAVGEKSVALKNENAVKGSFILSGGKIEATGEGSQILDNKGSLFVGENVEFGGEESDKFFIAVSHNEGGSVTPSSTIATLGETIHFTRTPDEGYVISDIKLDEISQSVSSDYALTVTKRHLVTVSFEKKTSNGGSGSGGGSSSGGSSSSSRKITGSAENVIPETPGSWVQDAAGWKFLNTAGSAYANTWVRKNSQWYWIGEDGYMKTGWNLINEKWYYLMPVSGEMKTGWIADGGNWYYADETGARATGWVKTGEKWYYLNADGKMAINTTTPDGYKVDENGAMVG